MENYTQLCVWPGTTLGGLTSAELEHFFAKEMGVRTRTHGEVTTLPDVGPDGVPDFQTGGRSDLFFYVHSQDIEQFAVPRLKLGIRWWEDVRKTSSHHYLPEWLDAHPATW